MSNNCDWLKRAPVFLAHLDPEMWKNADIRRAEVSPIPKQTTDYCIKPTAYSESVVQSYWDQRYLAEAAEPFDWLFSYGDVAHLMHQLLPKDAVVLMVGCGNAPFSKDMCVLLHSALIWLCFESVLIGVDRLACLLTCLLACLIVPWETQV